MGSMDVNCVLGQFINKHFFKYVALLNNILTKTHKNAESVMVKLTKQGYCAVLKTNIFHTLSLELPAATVIVIIQIFIKHHTAAKVSQILHVKYPALSQLYAALNIW